MADLAEAGLSDEMSFLDEPSAGDLHLKVTEAWRDFAGVLAAVLPGLPVGGHLDLTLDPTASGTGDAVYGVTIEAGADGVLVALAVGNAGLPDGFRLGRSEVAAMVALGWAPPGVQAGSGESFGLGTTTARAGQLAATVTRTLRDVYGAPHPAFLVYTSSDESDEPIHIQQLGTARHLSTVDAVDQISDEQVSGALELSERVRIVVAALLKTDPEELPIDADGDIGIRAGSAMVFVRVRDNPPLIDVFSPVLTEVEPTAKLYARLSDLTKRMPIGRLYCTADTVWASIPVFGRDFQHTHLSLAIHVMTGLADELDDRLHGEFGGKRFFGEGDKPATGGEERIGQYL